MTLKVNNPIHLLATAASVHVVVVYGSGNADGNRHTHSNLPILLAGKGSGSLSSGRRVNHNGKPLTNLYLTLGERMGMDALDSFGDSTGPLKDV